MGENKMSSSTLYEESLKDESMHTIGTTVDTGFEWEASDECKEKLSKDVPVVKERGKIHFNIFCNDFPKVQKMRSIDNILIVANVLEFDFSNADEEKNLQMLKDSVHNVMKLEKSLNFWKRVTEFTGSIYPSFEEHGIAIKNQSIDKKIPPTGNSKRKRGKNPLDSIETDVLRYRVTCERSGKHTFQSGDVARIIGGELQDKYHWVVDLTTYHLEIICKIIQNQMITYLRVTHESKHRRNICCFGPTTLRATVCYNMLRLANPKFGDIIIDPMCGTGSIPIEGALAYPNSYFLCGDINSKAVSSTQINIQKSCPRHNIDLIHWSVSQLPLRNSSADIVVTDMPFGKRSGNISDNRILYKKLLLELGRVVKQGTGRLILLTHDRRSLNMALKTTTELFRVTKMVGVNIGGLQAMVHVMKRSTMDFENFQQNLKTKVKRLDKQTLL